MQKNPQRVSIYWEASIFISEYGVFTLFCFLKTMCVLGHQESDFQSSFNAIECKKDVAMDRLKIVTDKCQNQVSESIVWPLRHSQIGQFSLTGRGGWYRRGKKHHKVMQKQRLQHLKTLLIHFIHFRCPWSTHKKLYSNMFRSSFKMTKNHC